MIYLKTPEEIRHIEFVNLLGATALNLFYNVIEEGLKTVQLEHLALDFCKSYKVNPAFKGYKGFPYSVCVSINDEVVHGFPSEYVIKSGDIVSVDFGLEKEGYYSDAAFTKIVGKVPKNIKRLVKVTEECLYKGIEQAVSGNRIYDISAAVYLHARNSGFDVVREFVGHGVGLQQHEEPKIPNYIAKGVNWKLRPGMVIAIEPMLVENDHELYIAKNGWTAITKDRRMSAHFERSVAILKSGPKILGNF